MESKILYRVFLDRTKHRRTGFTRHSRDGMLLSELPCYLQIESNPIVDGEYYLIHYDQYDEDISDTLHDSIEEAMKQARLEFNISQNEWERLID